MAARVLFFVRSATYESAYQVTSMGLTAAAMGEEVYFVFAFDALRALGRGTFGEPQSERERSELTRAEGLGVPSPLKMLQEARGLGARVLVCDTALRICGLAEKDLGSKIDEVLGLPSIWRLTDQARVLNF